MRAGAGPRSWRGEALRVVAIGGGLFAVSLVPYLIGHLNAPPGKAFNGFFYIADDAATYLSKMRQGADGAWGWSDPYIARPAANPVGLFLFYIAWGKLCGLLHIPLLAGYHLARLSGALALVTAVRFGVAEWLPEGRVRGLAVAMALLGSGLGYIVTALHQPAGLEALDLHLPELSAFYSILAIPHFAWAAALTTLALVALSRLAAAPLGRGLRPLLGAAAALLGLTLIHPQMVFVIAVLALVQLTTRRPRRQLWALSGLAFVAVLPLLYYNLRLLTDDPVIRQWSQQWKHQAPGFFSLLLGLGLPLGLALVAGVRGAWRDRPGVQLLVAWILLVLALVYLPNPVNIQRRLLDGIYVPVALLAAVGVDSLAGARPRHWRRLAAASLAAVSLSSLVVWGIGVEWAAARSEPQIYLDASVMRAIDWLGQARPQTGRPPVVLSHPNTGLFIPAYSGDRVFAGHYSETLDYAAKVERDLAAFREGPLGFVSLMREEGITYLFFGPDERALGGPPPSGAAELRLVYGRDGVSIYRLGG